jgi:hypothetical protein
MVSCDGWKCVSGQACSQHRSYAPPLDLLGGAQMVFEIQTTDGIAFRPISARFSQSARLQSGHPAGPLDREPRPCARGPSS